MASKKFAYGSQSILFVLVVLGFTAVINYLTTKKFLRLDMTQNRVYSISKPTKGLLRDLDDIVNISVYFSRNLPPHVKKLETEVRDVLSEYQAYAGKNLRISFEDPGQTEEAKQKVRGLGIPEIQMQTFEKDKAEVINGFLGLAVLYADKKEVLPVIQDMRNFEYDLTQAIMKVVRTTSPKIGVLKTDTMPYLPPDIARRMNIDATDKTEAKYKPIFENLQANYEVVTVDISDGQKIDSSITTLIVPGGDDKSFTERDLFEIDQYFMRGGNLIVLADAVKVSFEYGVNGSVQEPKILQLLEHYGARVEKSMLLDASCGQVQIPQKFGMFQMNVSVPYPYFVRVGAEGFNRSNPAVGSLAEMILPWASPITLLVDQADTASAGAKAAKEKDGSQKVAATVLATSSEKSWTAAGYFDLNPQQKWNPPQDQLKKYNLVVHLAGSFKSYFQGKSVPPVKDTDPADTLSKIQLSDQDRDRQVAAETQKGNLVLVGDSDFLTAQNAAPGNVAWLLNITDWLSLDRNLISIRSRNLQDRSIQKDKLKEGAATATVVRFANILGMPLLIICLGLAIFLKRRKAEDSAPAAVTTANKTEEKK